MTLEERKLVIIQELKILEEDCAWFNEKEHVNESINMLQQVPLRSDIYPEDHISKIWKKQHDEKIEIIRKT
jgi:hypothetical protein